MAKRKTSKLTSGTSVRVREGTHMPEFPSLDISGWEGMVMETQGKGSSQKVILEWSQASLEKMPAEYREHCESQGLFHGMACLLLTDLEVPGE